MKSLAVVGAAIVRDGLCLVAQRSERMSLPGKWEFPGGKVEPGEAWEAALAREIREELGLGIQVGGWLGRGVAQAGDRRIELDVFAACVVSGTLVLREHAAVCWVSAAELDSLDWAEADMPVLAAVKAHLTAR